MIPRFSHHPQVYAALQYRPVHHQYRSRSRARHDGLDDLVAHAEQSISRAHLQVCSACSGNNHPTVFVDDGRIADIFVVVWRQFLPCEIWQLISLSASYPRPVLVHRTSDPSSSPRELLVICVALDSLKEKGTDRANPSRCYRFLACLLEIV